MNMSIKSDSSASVRTGTPAGANLVAIPDDAAMLRAAVEQSRDISTPNPWIYWSDFLANAVVGYAASAMVIMSDSLVVMAVVGIVAVLALYRAVGFIHEITHLREGALPGFKLGWNLLIGIPLQVPSFMYEEIHTQHHARTRYGTVEDPEYLPLAHMKPYSLPLFILAAAFGPVAFLFRFAVVAPLSLLLPPLRRVVVERYSALSINPAYRRRPPEGAFRREWMWEETGASIWGMFMITSVALVGWKPLLCYFGIFSCVAVLNQLRTLVAHLWENDGPAITVTAQFLDSVNVPPPGIIPVLWAPVGLRYHALHHLLPSLPYHSLGEAHRRLNKELGMDSTYAQANHPGLLVLVARIAKSTMRVA